MVALPRSSATGESVPVAGDHHPMNRIGLVGTAKVRQPFPHSAMANGPPQFLVKLSAAESLHGLSVSVGYTHALGPHGAIDD